jgi:hypothetical protein
MQPPPPDQFLDLQGQHVFHGIGIVEIVSIGRNRQVDKDERQTLPAQDPDRMLISSRVLICLLYPLEFEINRRRRRGQRGVKRETFSYWMRKGARELKGY